MKNCLLLNSLFLYFYTTRQSLVSFALAIGLVVYILRVLGRLLDADCRKSRKAGDIVKFVERKYEAINNDLCEFRRLLLGGNWKAATGGLAGLYFIGQLGKTSDLLAVFVLANAGLGWKVVPAGTKRKCKAWALEALEGVC